MMRVLTTVRRGRSHYWPAWLRLLCLLVVIGAIPVVISSDWDSSPPVAPAGHLSSAPGDPAPGARPGWSTLVLYDPATEGATSGEVYGVQAANLVSHDGSFELRTVDKYRHGDLAKFSSIVYIGQPGAAPIPDDFLVDIRSGRKPVLWLGYGVERLFSGIPDYSADTGWQPDGRDEQRIAGVDYKGVRLGRDEHAEAPMRVRLMEASASEVLAEVVHDDGSRAPWAVRSGALTYIAEVPFSYVGRADRYLAAADLLRPQASPPRALRALVRLEDVGPATDPAQLRKIADSLAARQVPFSVAVYPRYRDPKGVANNGVPTDVLIADRPDLADALRYLIDRGGTLVLHGYTHQYGEEPNPYNGVSAADYEFYRARLGPNDTTELLGPVPDDSRDWARDRIDRARAELTRAGLPDPKMFEFPHYTASAVDYQAATAAFGVRYDRGSYFTGWCEVRCGHSGAVDPKGIYSQAFPYLVRDVYGAVVVPENLGYVSSWSDDGERDRQIDAILTEARALRVVDDGVASFFYHPTLGDEALGSVIDGIQAAGYRFVPASEIQRG